MGRTETLSFQNCAYLLLRIILVLVLSLIADPGGLKIYFWVILRKIKIGLLGNLRMQFTRVNNESGLRSFLEILLEDLSEILSLLSP